VERVLRDKTLIIVVGIGTMWAFTCGTFLVYKGFTAEIRSALVIVSQIVSSLVVFMGLRTKAVETSNDVKEVKENIEHNNETEVTNGKKEL
jgi:multisubunit Na+/H+ antiporter MnhC subunit